MAPFQPSVATLPISSALFVGALCVFLVGCSTMERTPMTQPLKIEKSSTAPVSRDISANNARRQITAEDGLRTPMGRNIAEPVTSNQAPSLEGESISINFEGVQLPSFVNTVFGDLLNVTFEIDSAVQQREQLVTLRTAQALTPNDFYQLVTQVLSNYGISIAYQNNVYRIVENSQAQREIPRIVRSRAFSNVPGDMRPVFYYALVDNIRVKTMQVWLDLTLRQRVQIMNVPYTNALLLLGNAEDVAAAIEVIETLDQPNLAGSRSLKISPAFWSAEKLTQQLVEVLRAEGYWVEIGSGSDAPIQLVPVGALNAIIVFASSEQNLRHVFDWAAELDQPGQTINTTGVYYHQVQNTNAEDLAAVMESVLVSNDSEGAPNDALQVDREEEIGIIVDKARNGIIFKGTAEQYAQFRTIIEQMDRAPFEVLIEATVAEVTLDEGESLGVVLKYDDGASATGSRSTIQSEDGLVVNLIRDQGDFSASLSAAADESKVTILSSPRLVAASGKTASMQVGTQVPIITTQQTAPDGSVGGTSNILQQVQYRDTGVVLNFSPIVNSNRRVELTINQEVSDAQSNDTSDIQSPIILTRGFTTTLSIDDGETVMLAGLISENFSVGDTGVPYLKDIPLLGNLFKSQSRSRQKTELIVLLTPYIIDGRDTSRAVRDAFRAQLSGLESAFPDAEED